MIDMQLTTVGRLLIALYFVASGIRHFWIYPGTIDMMRKRGVPWPSAALACGTAFEIAAGLALAAGYGLVVVVVGLSIFTIVAGVIALDFWNQQEPQRSGSISAWLANVAVIGGMLLIVTQSTAPGTC